MLDSMDVMLYSLVLAHMMGDLGMDKSLAGALGSVTLVASAIGGLAFGVLADRIGRTRALMGSILIYSIFTAACGFARTPRELAVFRFFLGLGMGGEWATGASLVAETWSAKDRGKALAVVQSAWAVGYALAAVITAVVLPTLGWRAVFFVGVIPALVTLWIRKAVPEPEIWTKSRTADTRGRFSTILSGTLGRRTLALTLLQVGACSPGGGSTCGCPPTCRCRS